MGIITDMVGMLSVHRDVVTVFNGLKHSMTFSANVKSSSVNELLSLSLNFDISFILRTVIIAHCISRKREIISYAEFHLVGTSISSLCLGNFKI